MTNVFLWKWTEHRTPRILVLSKGLWKGRPWSTLRSNKSWDADTPELPPHLNILPYLNHTWHLYFKFWLCYQTFLKSRTLFYLPVLGVLLQELTAKQWEPSLLFFLDQIQQPHPKVCEKSKRGNQPFCFHTCVSALTLKVLSRSMEASGLISQVWVKYTSSRSWAQPFPGTELLLLLSIYLSTSTDSGLVVAWQSLLGLSQVSLFFNREDKRNFEVESATPQDLIWFTPTLLPPWSHPQNECSLMNSSNENSGHTRSQVANLISILTLSSFKSTQMLPSW